MRTRVRVGRGDARGGRPKCAQKTQDTYFAAASVQDARSFLQLLPPLHSDSHWSSTLKNYRERSVVSEAGGVWLWARERARERAPERAQERVRERALCQEYIPLPSVKHVPNAFACATGPMKREMVVRE